MAYNMYISYIISIYILDKKIDNYSHEVDGHDFIYIIVDRGMISPR